MQILKQNNSVVNNIIKDKKIINRLQANSSKILYLDLGLIPYNDAYNLQTYFFNQVKLSSCCGVILLLEHTPVITIGNNKKLDNLLVSNTRLKEQNIELVQSNRGGDITFHGPGQIVCYPILNLSYVQKDLSLYVHNLEQLIIEVLNHYGIYGTRIAKHRGVFVKNYKIASIGVRIKKWIAMHGFSLNVNVNLSYFDSIIACGLKKYSQISMQKILNKDIPISDVKEQILIKFNEVFGLPVLK